MHTHSTFQMQSVVFKTASINTEFPKSQDISVGIYGRFVFETLWEWQTVKLTSKSHTF